MAHLPLGCAGSRKTSLTPEEILERDTQFEREVLQKQRLARFFDSGKGGGKGAAKIVKQRKVLRILLKENLEVETDLGPARAPEKILQDALTTDDIRNLLKTYDDLSGKINVQRSDLKDIEYTIDSVKKRIVYLKQFLITDAAWDKYVQEGEQQLSNLENKLETQTKGFCKIIVNTKRMREEIEHRLIERREFNKQWNNIVGTLHKGKTFLMDIVEQATLAYDQREECCQQLDALRNKAYTDLILQTEEMVTLQRKLDNEYKLRDFLRVKCQKRWMRDLEENLKKKHREKFQQIEKHLIEYQELLAMSADFVGASEGIDSIISKYMQLEETNFAKFNLVCNFGREIEDLSEVLYELQHKIDEQYILRENREKHQTQNLEKYAAELEQATKETEEADALLKQKEEKLEKVFAGIERLFHLCACSQAPILQLLGNNTKVHPFNSLLHLNLMENKIRDLIILCLHKQKTDVKPKSAKGAGKKAAPAKAPDIIRETDYRKRIYLIDEIVRSNPCPLCVDQEMVSDVIDDLQFVENIEEIKRRLATRMKLPGALQRIHNVSGCHLPKSREIIQRRYQ